MLDLRSVIPFGVRSVMTGIRGVYKLELGRRSMGGILGGLIFAFRSSERFQGVAVRWDG